MAEYKVSKSMHNPPHPGEIIKDAIIDGRSITVKQAAEYLDVDRVTLSRLLNGKAAISVEMALRLSRAMGTTPDMWLNMQSSYDLPHLVAFALPLLSF
jgi:addiction module HigA family antidote